MTGTTARSQDCTNKNDNGGIITMKTKEEMIDMLCSRLTELQDMKHKPINARTATYAVRLQTELILLSDILGKDVPEEYLEQIEEEI